MSAEWAQCMRLSVMGVNVIFAIDGVSTVIMGTLRSRRIDWLGNQVSEYFHVTFGWSIGLGIVIILLSYLGLCGSFKMTRKLLIMYATFMSLYIIMKIIAINLIFISTEDAATIINNMMKNLSKQNKPRFHELEAEWNCCGLKDFRDYEGVLPSSCCISAPCDEKNAYQVGCSKVMHESYMFLSNTTGGVMIFTTIVQIITTIFSVYLASICPKE